MFNKLLEEKQLKYVFTDKRKLYYSNQIGNGLGEIFKSILPHAIKFGKKLLPALGVTGITATTSHLINKSLNKEKKGGSIKINLSQSNIKKINDILEKSSNMKLTNYKSISEQNRSGIFTSILLPLIGSMIPSLLNKGSGVCCKKDNFFEKINNKSLYPISNSKINEILKNDKNYIGTFSKNNVRKLKNNE